MSKVEAFGIRYKPTGQWRQRSVPSWRPRKFSDIPSLYFRKCDVTQTMNRIRSNGTTNPFYDRNNYEVVNLEVEWKEI